MPTQRKNFPAGKRKLPSGIEWKRSSNTYRIQYRDRSGRRRSETLSTLELAKQTLAARRTDIARGKLGFIADDKAPTFREFAKTYVESHVKVNGKTNMATWEKTDRYRLIKLVAVFGDYRLSDITPIRVETYRKAEVERGRNVEGVNRDLRLMKAILNRAVALGVLSQNPIASIKYSAKLEEKRFRVLTDVEERALFQQLTGVRAKLRPLVTVAIHTGMRRGEILGLEWRDVDFDKQTITIRREMAKSRKSRIIPMNELVSATLRLLGIRESGKVFDGFGKVDGLDDLLTRAMNDAGIKDAGTTWHVFRHTFCSRLLASGVDIKTVQHLAGHGDIKTTMVYLHSSEQQRRDAVDRLWNGHSSRDVALHAQNE